MGGDRSQSILCFECMNRVWTGHNWRLVNTCKPEYFTSPFFQGGQQQDNRHLPLGSLAIGVQDRDMLERLREAETPPPVWQHIPAVAA